MKVEGLMRRIEDAKGCHEKQETGHENVEYSASRILLSSNRI